MVVGGDDDSCQHALLRPGGCGQAEAEEMSQLRGQALDATPDRTGRPGDTVAGDDIRLALQRLDSLREARSDKPLVGTQVELVRTQKVEAPAGGEIGVIEEATAHHNVEWAAGNLAHVRACESSNRLRPCVVGSAGELGPYQFLPSTWATTPYADFNPCGLRAATYAAAWMVSEGRQYEFTCWPR